MDKVLILILNYNGKTLLKDILDKSIVSLIEQSYTNKDIIFIDNNSSDSSCEYIKSKYKDIRIVKLEKNMGTIAINRGFKICLKENYDYVLMSNNDIVYDKDFIKNMVYNAKNKKDAGILTPRIMFLDYPDIYNSTGIIMNKSGFAWDRHFNKNINKIGTIKSNEVLFASGGAMFIKREILEKIGFLDSIYFAYYEDVDFSMRVRLLTNYKIYYIDSAVCYHKFSASWNKRGKKDFYMMRNRFFFVIKCFPFVLLLHSIRYLLFISKTGNRFIDRRVYFDIIINIPLLLFKRLKINKKRFPYSLLEDYHGYPQL